MKNFKWGVLTVLALALVACNGSNDSPKGALDIGLKALQANNLNNFTSVLTSDALTTYGNAAGFQKLRTALSSYSKFNVRTETLVSTQQGDQGCGIIGDVLRQYTEAVDASGNGVSEEFDAGISCSVRCEIRKGVCRYSPIPGNPAQCDPDQYLQFESCFISSLPSV